MNLRECSGKIFNIQKFSIHDGPGIRTLAFFQGCPLKCYWCANPEGINLGGSLIYDETSCKSCKKCLECPNSVHTFSELELNHQNIISHQNTISHVMNRKKCSLCGLCAQICSFDALKYVGNRMTVDEVFSIVCQDIVFYSTSGGGITLGGGEPTMQPEFAKSLLRKCKENKINTVVETCGHCNFEVLRELSRYVDSYYIDIKHMESNKHLLGTGKGNDLILDNISRLLTESEFDSSSFGITIRVPVIPGFNDDESNIRATADFLIKNNVKGRLKGLELLPYHRFGVSKYRKLGMDYAGNLSEDMDKERIEFLKGIISKVGGL